MRRRVRAELHRFRHLRARRLDNLRFVGLAQLHRAAAHAAVLARARQHVLLRRRRRAAVDRRCRWARRCCSIRRSRGSQGFFRTALFAPVVTTLVAVADRVALPVQPALRTAQLRARATRHRSDRLARRSALGDAGDHPLRRMEELRLQHDDPARRPAEHSRRPLRGGAHRRRLALAAVPPRDVADARADAARWSVILTMPATSSSSPSPTS